MTILVEQRAGERYRRPCSQHTVAQGPYLRKPKTKGCCTNSVLGHPAMVAGV